MLTSAASIMCGTTSAWAGVIPTSERKRMMHWGGTSGRSPGRIGSGAFDASAAKSLNTTMRCSGDLSPILVCAPCHSKAGKGMNWPRGAAAGGFADLLRPRPPAVGGGDGPAGAGAGAAHLEHRMGGDGGGGGIGAPALGVLGGGAEVVARHFVHVAERVVG